MRYRLSTLLVAMVWVGLVCLALRSPNHWWSGGMFAVLVLVLLTSVLVAIYRTGQLRAMAIGFFIFSAGYLTVEGNFWPGRSPAVALPTHDVVRWFFTKVHVKSGQDLDRGLEGSDPFAPHALAERFTAFEGVCTSALAVVLGLIGAIIAQALCHTQPAERKPPAGLSG